MSLWRPHTESRWLPLQLRLFCRSGSCDFDWGGTFGKTQSGDSLSRMDVHQAASRCLSQPRRHPDILITSIGSF